MNPVVALRKTHNLTRTQFAQRMGLSYRALQQIECGYLLHLPYGFIMTLSRAGFEATAIAEEYIQWREGAHALSSR